MFSQHPHVVGVNGGSSLVDAWREGRRTPEGLPGVWDRGPQSGTSPGTQLGGWGVSFKVSSGWGPTMKLSPREDWGSLQGQVGGDTPVPFSSPLVKWPSKGIHFIRWEHSELFIVLTQ